MTTQKILDIEQNFLQEHPTANTDGFKTWFHSEIRQETLNKLMVASMGSPTLLLEYAYLNWQAYSTN